MCKSVCGFTHTAGTHSCLHSHIMGTKRIIPIVTLKDEVFFVKDDESRCPGNECMCVWRFKHGLFLQCAHAQSGVIMSTATFRCRDDINAQHVSLRPLPSAPRTNLVKPHLCRRRSRTASLRFTSRVRQQPVRGAFCPRRPENTSVVSFREKQTSCQAFLGSEIEKSEAS